MTEKEAIEALKAIGAQEIHIGATRVDGRLCFGVSFKVKGKRFESTVDPNGNWTLARLSVLNAIEKYLTEAKAILASP